MDNKEIENKAREIRKDIIEQVYTETGDFKIKEYLKNR